MAPTIAFFMIVTDRDCVIADYAVRSYARIRDVPFRLVIHSNWVRSDLKRRYFSRWRRLPYVEIQEDPSQSDENKPCDRTLYGPFEIPFYIWDRELPKLTDTPFHAVVDADFEILDPTFVSVMLQRLKANRKLAAISTDYSPRNPEYRDSYINQIIDLHERWHTHFCIYRRESLACRVSYACRKESAEGDAKLSFWDDHAYFQMALRASHGFDLSVLEPRFRRGFIHYGGFAQNRHIDDANVRSYRAIQILRNCGLPVLRDPISRLLGYTLDRLLFRQVDRSTFVPGWALPDAQAAHLTRVLH